MKLISIIALLVSTAVFAQKADVAKKVFHDPEHHHVDEKGEKDHSHDDAHHADHDHKAHHAGHDTHMKEHGDVHKKHDLETKEK